MGVAEYRRKFIELLAPLENIPEEVAKGQFINGLAEGIKAELRVSGPTNLDQPMDLARGINEPNRDRT